MNVTEQTPAETQPWQLLQQAELRAGSHRGCVFTGGRREGLEGASGMGGSLQGCIHTRVWRAGWEEGGSGQPMQIYFCSVYCKYSAH